MNKRWNASLMVLAALFSSSAFAFSDYNLMNANLNDGVIESLLKTAAMSSEHRPYSSASPLGYVIGLDVGIAITAAPVTSDFKSALSLATGQAESEIPAFLPVPQIAIRKGFPKGFDLGITFATSSTLLGQPGLFSLYGGDLQWAFVSGAGAKPALAARISYSNSTLWFLKTNSYALDVIASKNLYIIDPYAGIGLKHWSGSLELQPFQELPYTVSGSKSGTNPHVFFGLPLKMAFINMTFEADYNFNGMSTYGSKISLHF
ncbi:MAG: hypothetical protein A2Z97_16290 [Bdellovibrionales bacterium GWB1_52_6]|nr:MAG: hypothetical protein A2Z97_16290 [Bdellovibrionales bacterium GWB1_52_6]OFZ04551.1 MAG: hypothetical protein A2X97_13080 [Bdellovibrionales bacterium GWA1_52_35]HCM39959.1 hypothetical protein [Bdellovibrionales bacterium]